MTTFWILLIAIIIIGAWLIAVYNGLIKAKNRTEEAFSDIDVQLKRRHDLIPNLVNTVKGYASHEASVFTQVTEARSQAMQAKSIDEKIDSENQLMGALKSLFAVAENYPELKANENFLHLQQELADTENKIQASRRFYNGNVRDFNTKLQVFPTNLIASILGFSAYKFFEAEEEAKAVPQVDFSANPTPQAPPAEPETTGEPKDQSAS
ncbi:LemA family protein [Candidatus Uhrbacteria bacterium]|nr:LemA family protein [Candidatus Uhrbacteria bacterium]